MRMLFKKRALTVPLLPEPLPAQDRPAPSFLAADLAIIGTVASTGTIVADGRIDGPCCAKHVTIGENGRVHGDVIASELVIRSHVEGNLSAVRVQLYAQSTVDGDVPYRTLSIDAGARLKGTCRYADDPPARVAAPMCERFARLAAGATAPPNTAP